MYSLKTSPTSVTGSLTSLKPTVCFYHCFLLFHYYFLLLGVTQYDLIVLTNDSIVNILKLYV